MTSMKGATQGLVQKMRNHPRVLLISVGVAILAVWSVTYVMRDFRYRGVPKRAIAAIEAGDLALAKDSIEQALHHYFDATDLDPTLSEVFGKIAEGYYLAGQKHKVNRNTQLQNAMFGQAYTHIEKALATNPTEPHAIYVQGLLDYEKGRKDSALAKMQMAEALGLKTFNLHSTLGFLFNEMNEPGKALEQLKKAYALRPNDETTLYNLFELYFHFEQYSHAVSACSELMKTNPGNNQYKALYAAAIWKNGNEQMARDIFNEIINGTKGREFYGYNTVGWVLIDKNVDPAWGLRLAQAADALKPNNLQSVDILGWGYFMTGDYENAVKYLNRSMIKKPSDEVRRRLQMAKDKLEESRKK